mmetsp:Transcript_8665/g.8793  ORF Transcript_8665/g.8793 Transcript_8665/m.8793 type:complete len:96 (-) Transcript_8665:2230-2517(-)
MHRYSADVFGQRESFTDQVNSPVSPYIFNICCCFQLLCICLYILTDTLLNAYDFRCAFRLWFRPLLLPLYYIKLKQRSTSWENKSLFSLYIYVLF